MQIAVIDFGIGNLRSVEQALNTVSANADIVVTHDAELISAADKVVMPGQGAVGTWFKALEQRGLAQAIEQSLAEKPVLGICVGMQALFDFCDEDGGVDGMGVFEGSVKHFSEFHIAPSKPALEPASANTRLKIPQMGWNQVFQRQEHALWHGIDDQSYFYFVHSFCANTKKDQSAVFGTADYGHEFISAVGRDNIFAVQFHPEKSHNDGLTLLKNFTQWNG